MAGGRRRSAALAALAVGGGGVAARSARLLWRRREVNWSAPERFTQDAYLSCQTMGSGPSPVLLLHPLGDTSSYFGSAFDELAAPGPLLVPDLLGFGGSPPSEAGYGPDDHADALARMLDLLEVREPALVVGHGLGGVIGLRLAVRHPGRVRALVAISPQIYSDPASAHRHLRRAGLRVPPLRGWLPARTGRRAARRALAPAISADVPSRVARDRHDSKGSAAYRGTLVSCLIEARAADWFPDVTCPVDLVLPAGDRSLEVGLLEKVSSENPSVRLTQLMFGDYRLPLTHPDGCLAAVDRFREELAAT